MTQASSVYPDLTVQQNLRYFAALAGSGDAEIDAVLADVDLTDHRLALTGNLSGGQRTRVSLAAALVGQPELLLLDEPTVGLDPVLRRDLWQLFHRLAERGRTLLVSSHVMDEAGRCERVLLMRDGPADRRRQPGRAARANRRAGPGTGLPAAGRTASVMSEHRSEERARSERPAMSTGAQRGMRVATARRVLQQLAHDRRSIVLLLVVPSILLDPAEVCLFLGPAAVRPDRAAAARRVPVHHHVPDHLDHHGARTHLGHPGAAARPPHCSVPSWCSVTAWHSGWQPCSSPA